MKTRLPKLCRNKLRDAAFVYCGKRKIYLGKWGAPETIAAYRRYIAELASDRVAVGDGAEAEKTVVTVAELAVAFLSDKKDYYVKDGASTRQHERYRVAIRSRQSAAIFVPSSFAARSAWLKSDADCSFAISASVSDAAFPASATLEANASNASFRSPVNVNVDASKIAASVKSSFPHAS